MNGSILNTYGNTYGKARRARAAAAAFCLFSAAAPVVLPAQTVPNISVDVNLVVVHATVEDGHGEFVQGLGKEEFKVFENGKEQTIRLFRDEDVPVSVGLLVDNSTSMSSRQKDVAAAAVAFAESSNPLDEMFVVQFNEHVTLGLPSTKLFSASPSELEAAVNAVHAFGRTALYDAIAAGLTHLKQATHDKKVLILVSDGGDNSSRHTLKEILADAERSNVIIYAIGMLDEHDADQNPAFLRKIARITGGVAFLPEEASEAAGICRRIAADIRHQYTIGYTPTDDKLDNTYRKIKITAKGPNRGRLHVRTRTGYIASPPGANPTGDSQGQERHR